MSAVESIGMFVGGVITGLVLAVLVAAVVITFVRERGA